MRVLLIAFVFLPVSCTVTVPQLDSLSGFFTVLNGSTEESQYERSPTWLGRIDQYGAVLKPFANGELVVFANAEGDAVAFDGWTIRSITGFGLNVPMSILGKDGTRTFVIDNTVLKVVCDPWEWKESRWTQSCTNGTGVITLNENKEIQFISMPLVEDFGEITLRLFDE